MLDIEISYPIESSFQIIYSLIRLCKEEETQGYLILTFNQRKIKNLQTIQIQNTFNVLLGFSFSRLDVNLHHVDNCIPCDLPQQMERDQMADDYPPIIPCVY